MSRPSARSPAPSSRSTCAAPRDAATWSASPSTSERRADRVAAAESYPDELRYHEQHDWARIEDGEATLGITWFAQDALGELVHFEAPEDGATVAKDQSYGEVESVKAVSDVIAPLSGEIVAVNSKVVDEPETVNEEPYGEGWLIRIRLSDPSEVEALLDGDAYLSLTDADREAMLAAIGVDSVDELFRDVPEGVRFQGRLALEPPLSEQELVSHLTELAERNVPAGEELSFLGAGIYDHYVPAVVDSVLAQGQLLTAYTPYQPEVSQGVLQAIFEYQTAICELTGMDVSNASGYDGTTVAADACYLAKHATGRSKVVLTEATSPQVRQVVKTYAPGFGMEVVEVAHRDGVTDPDELREAARDAACIIFQQPNFFGCLEPAPDLAAAANEADALPIAHVDPVSLGVLEAPGNYGADLAIGEGQSAGNAMSFGGPHYGFLAARQEYIRRLPGRIVGETVDAAGDRGYVLTLQTREQHIRREKATSNITTNQTLLALGGLVHLSLLGPQGLRETGETCIALAQYAKDRLVDAGLELVFPDRTTFKEFAVRTGRSATDSIEAARARGVYPGYPLGRDYEGMDDALLVALTERRTTEEIDRLVEALAR